MTTAQLLSTCSTTARRSRQAQGVFFGERTGHPGLLGVEPRQRRHHQLLTLRTEREQDPSSIVRVRTPGDEPPVDQGVHDPVSVPLEMPASAATCRVSMSPQIHTTHSTTHPVQVRSWGASTVRSR